MIASSFGITSSCLNSSIPVLRTFVFRSSPNFSLSAINSSFTTAKIFFLLESKSSKNAINFNFSLSSSSIFFFSRPANVCSLISKIALACNCESLNFRIKFACASSLVADFLIVSMTASMLSRAIFSPSKMCALSLALLRSNCVRRVTTMFR
ncbi:MAG: hypothetical protein ACD_8C00019G0001 [uncultured bacterium]|nr:MAG: hypothetical protein ACD_8C00019G0001 [uncultured bacterium]